MHAGHLEKVLQVQAQTFTKDLRESAEVFANRLTRFGTHFKVACLQEAIVGYMLCFPWKLGETPVNNRAFPDMLPEADCLYIHDIALLPEARGSGLARAMVDDAFAQAQAHGFPVVSLVAVAQSGLYWDKVGFVPCAAITADKQAQIIHSYGEGARLMVKPVLHAAAR